MKLKRSGWHIAVVGVVIAILLVSAYFFLPTALTVLFKALKIFLPFILGYLCSLLINPLADKLQKKLKLPRGISALLVIILTVGIVGGIATGVIWKIVAEVRSLYSQMPRIYIETSRTWRELSEKFSVFYGAMPEGIKSAFDGLGDQVSIGISEFFTHVPVVERAGDFAKALPGVFISVIVFFLSLFFMVVDADKVRKFLDKIFTHGFISKVSGIKHELKKYVGGYIKAQATIMSIAFVIIFIGLSIFKIEYALLIAIGIAILDALPFFGSGAVLWPWAIISLINGSIKLTVGLIIIYFTIIFIRQMIEPKIVSSNIGLNPICTLMAMYVGYKVFSIGGMLLGPVTLMLLISFYKAGLFEPFEKLFRLLIKFVKNEFIQLKSLFIDNEK